MALPRSILALSAGCFGIGTTEVEHVLATQTLVYRLAKGMRIRVDGELPLEIGRAHV